MKCLSVTLFNISITISKSRRENASTINRNEKHVLVYFCFKKVPNHLYQNLSTFELLDVQYLILFRLCYSQVMFSVLVEYYNILDRSFY